MHKIMRKLPYWLRPRSIHAMFNFVPKLSEQTQKIILISLIPILSLTTYFILSFFAAPSAPKLKNGSGDTLFSASNKIFSTSIGTKAGESKIGFSVGNSQASFILAGANKVTPKKESSTSVLFPGVQENTNLRYTTTVDGLKEELILKSAPSTPLSNIFLFDLTLNNVIPKKLTNNFIEQTFKDSKGIYQFHFEKPFAVDANGNRTNNVLLQIGEDKQIPGKYYMKLIVDESWLNDPTRIYPVTIDPTIVHDTTAEFAAGTLNHLKDTGPGATTTLETYYQELPSDQNTVGLWHLNDASGNALDSSGNGNTLTNTAATVDTTTQLLGSAARVFSGGSQYLINAALSPTLASDLTIQLWFKTSTTPNVADRIMSFGQSAVRGAQIYMNTTGNVGIDNSGGPTVAIQTAGNYVDGRWHHAAMTRIGTNYSLYVDGSFIGTVGGTAPIFTKLNLARIWDDETSNWQGELDEVKLSNIALSSEEIKSAASRRPYAIYTSDVIDFTYNVNSWNPLTWAEHGVNTGDGETLKNYTSLIAQWNFNETSGTTADNAEGTATHDGTLAGFTSTATQDQAAGTGWTSANRRWGAGALMFDGSNDYVSITDSAAWDFASNNFTFEFTVKMNALEDTGFFGQSDGGGNNFKWGVYWNAITANKLTFHNNTNAGSITNISWSWIPTIGKWHHIVITRSSNSWYLYVDGQVIDSPQTSALSVANSSANPRIGADGEAWKDLNGTLDSFRLYSRTLSASEIMSNYQAGNIDFETRVGADTSPDDGSWEAWKPITGETSIDSMDSSVDEWFIDNNQDSSSTINKIGAVNTGTGNDGACIMDNGTKTLDSTIGSSVCNSSARSTAYAVNFSVTGNTVAGSTSITVSSTPTGLVAGDEFMIINLQGTSTNYQNVGKYETHVISSISTNTLNFTDYPLKYSYDGTTQKIMVQRVPNFGAITICGGNTGSGCSATATLTASAWNGTKNGVLFFRSTGTVTVNSSGLINTKSTGYRDGQASIDDGTCSDNIATQNGESYTGAPSVSTANNGGGSGGIAAVSGVSFAGTAFVQSSAGGDTPGKTGVAANSRTPGTAGARYGNNSLLLMGSGAGGGITCSGGTFSPALSGSNLNKAGGIIYISANSLTINGGINNSGTDMASPNVNGGTSGGTVQINANSLTLGSSLLTSIGAVAGSVQGGNGRIILNYVSSISGATSPSSYIARLQSAIKSEGNGAMQIQTSRPEVDSGTVALWHLDETGGTSAYIKDSTANANNGTPTGTTIVNGIASKARNFNGTSDYIDVPDSSNWAFGTGDFSISTWVKFTDIATHRAIIGQRQDGTNFMGLYWNQTANKLYFHAIDSGVWRADYNFNWTPTPNIWYHIEVVRQGTNFNMYLNGAAQSLITTTAISTNSIGNITAPLGIGLAETFYMKGSIDEIRVSNSARSAEEIAEAYRMGRDHYINRTITATDLSGKSSLPFYVAADRPGSYLSATIGESAFANYQPDTNTVGLWHLEEQDRPGPHIIDSSGNGNTLTATATTIATGKIGKSRNFNGSSAYLSRADNSTLELGSGDFTISLWTKFGSLGSTQGLITKWNSSGNMSYALDWSSSNLLRFHCSAAGTADAEYNVSWTPITNTWYHVALNRSGSTLTYYINGQNVGTNSISGSCYNASSDLLIGAMNTGSVTYFHTGSIDEARVDNTARTATEIRQAYEVGLRTHPVTIDFGAKLDAGNLITGSGDLGFTVDATYYGLQQKGDQLFKGDKVIVRENYDGTEYIAQGTVDSITASTGATTVSSWDSGSTFPGSGFTANASVFKWQREYWNIKNETLSTSTDAITNFTLRLTDGNEGRTVWLDDLRSNSDYLTNPSGSTITSSVGNRYLQYRTILTSFDEAVSATLSAVTVDYVANSVPLAPSLDLPADAATNQLLSPILKTTTTDLELDYIRYKIQICTDVAMSLNCQLFDQTSSQTGWSGQNAQTSTAYTSGTQATFTIQTPLLSGTTYYWRTYGIDPGGVNTWGSTQTPRSFTTSTAPTAPTIPYAEGLTNPTGIVDLTPEFSAIHNDPDGDAANKYQIQVNTASDFTGTVIWDTGVVSIANLADGVRKSDVSYAGTALAYDAGIYFWRIKFTDVNGAEGAWSAVQNFSTNIKPNIPSLDSPGNGVIDQNVILTFQTTGTDDNSDYLKYKIRICTDLAMTVGCQTFDQTSSQTGWSGQNTQTSTAYASGTQALHTLQSNLAANTTYYWVTSAIDPAGTNTWGYEQITPYSFTTIIAPPTANSCRIRESKNDTSLTVIWTDMSTIENGYEVQRSVDSGAFATLVTGLASNTISYQDNTISNGHTYRYRVAPYFTGPVFGTWCVTAPLGGLNLQLGTFKFN